MRLLRGAGFDSDGFHCCVLSQMVLCLKNEHIFHVIHDHSSVCITTQTCIQLGVELQGGKCVIHQYLG